MTGSGWFSEIGAPIFPIAYESRERELLWILFDNTGRWLGCVVQAWASWWIMERFLGGQVSKRANSKTEQQGPPTISLWDNQLI